MKALITGVAGQDGSFLAEMLLGRGYEVHGTVRDEGSEAAGAAAGVVLHRAELLDAPSLIEAVRAADFDEIYHLAAPSFVPASWEHPAETFAAVAGATAVLLGAVREHRPGARVYVASSATIYGGTDESPQNEDTLCRPLTPYAVAKLASHQLVGVIRERFGLHVSSGITFNHESERRPERFVTRRITRAAAAISLGQASEVTLGSLDSVRDWSFAGDVMDGAWLMCRAQRPGDYVLASGVGHTVREFAQAAFACVGLDAAQHVRVDESLVRGDEGAPSVGDPARARRELGWEPRVSFEQLVERMVRADLDDLRRQ